MNMLTLKQKKSPEKHIIIVCFKNFFRVYYVVNQLVKFNSNYVCEFSDKACFK